MPQDEVVGSASGELLSGGTGPDQASLSAVTVAFQLDPGVHKLAASSPLHLVATNHLAEPVSAELSLRLRGLGAKRVVDLGKLQLAAGETRIVPWVPATSPIAPSGTSASVLAIVRYDSAGNALAIPSQPMTMSFDKTGATAFVSTSDDLGVRLASLGRPYASAAKAKGISASDRAAVLAALGGHRGRRDGVALNESPLAVAERLPGEGAASDEGDVVPIPGDVVSSEGSVGITADEGTQAAGEGDMQESARPAFTFPFPLCILWDHRNTKTGKYCAYWQPQGFRDVGISSGVEPEDFTGEGPAAYANAVARSASTVVWQGRLDAYGCTPVIEFCNNQEHLDVSTASLQNPSAGFAETSRMFQIEPAFTYAASPSLRLTLPPNQNLVAFNINSGTAPVRVASVVSRILTMPDNGVRLESVFVPGTPLVIHTDEGCQSEYTNPPYPSNFAYIDPVTGQEKHGAACAGADEAWFGQVLSLQESPSGGYMYVPTSWHTTQDAVTIGHELGHSAQYALDGGPTGTGYADKPATGDCSCEWVASGNRTHCLQSRHGMASAEGEGFGHFYASRILNDFGQGLDARFTYYKTFRLKLFGSDYAVPPPIPLSIAQPSGGTGWVRAWCPAPNKSSEYDWLTFFWAINGKAAPNERSTMNDIFTILRNSSGNFIWQNIRSQANAYYVDSLDPRAQLFGAELTRNGLAL